MDVTEGRLYVTYHIGCCETSEDVRFIHAYTMVVV